MQNASLQFRFRESLLGIHLASAKKRAPSAARLAQGLHKTPSRCCTKSSKEKLSDVQSNYESNLRRGLPACDFRVRATCKCRGHRFRVRRPSNKYVHWHD